MSAKNDKAKGKSKQIESTHVSDLSIVSVIQYFFLANHESTNKCTCCINIDYIEGAEYNSKVKPNSENGISTNGRRFR